MAADEPSHCSSAGGALSSLTGASALSHTNWVSFCSSLASSARRRPPRRCHSSGRFSWTRRSHSTRTESTQTPVLSPARLWGAQGAVSPRRYKAARGDGILWAGAALTAPPAGLSPTLEAVVVAVLLLLAQGAHNREEHVQQQAGLQEHSGQ